jgi:hypothetical protein
MTTTKLKNEKLGRRDLPVSLPGATSFSDDRDVLSPLQVVRLLKEHPEIVGDLISATTVVHEGRKKRLEGSWALAFLVFTCSSAIDMEPWWVSSIDTLVWEECGFDDRPAFNTMYDRFVEMEKLGFELHFRLAAHKLIRRARKHSKGLVGRDVHIDGTEAETNARLVHICGASCPQGKKKDGSKKKRGPAELPARLPTESVRAIRHQQSDTSPEELPPLNAGQARRVIYKVDEQTGQEYLLVQDKKGCWYRSLDTSAGTRSYDGPRGSFRYWHGFYNIKPVDHYTGGALDVYVMNASINEHQANPVVTARVEEAIGDVPRSYCYDKGSSIDSVFEQNTKKGAATVAPYRRGRSGTRADYDCDVYDRHGIPRCKHCGHEGKYVSFTLSPKPRLIYKCAAQCAESAGKRMSVYCEEKWRFLVPLWRNEEAYMALRNAGKAYEGVHRYWRDRYKVGGTDFYTRPKRIGRDWQQLRASAALLAEWIKICFREGWLGSPRRNTNQPYTRNAAHALKSFLGYRIFIGLDAMSAGQLPPKKKAEPPPDGGSPPGFITGGVDDIPF